MVLINMKLNARQAKVVKIGITTLLALLAFGTVMFHSLEDWTWIESFYFTVVTLTTVGYGDLSPSSDATRLAVALFILFGVAIVGAIISTVGSAFLRRRVERRLSDKN